MPWRVEASESCPASKPWAVVRETDGEIEGCHETKADAEAQMAALYASEDVDKADAGDPFEVTVRIAKTETKQQVALGIVLEPRTSDTPDTQGDWYTAEDIELAAYQFMEKVAKGKAWGDLMHDEVSVIGYPVESYIARTDFMLGDQLVKTGSWVMGMHYPDPNIWESIEKGELAAFSVGGRGTRLVEA